MFGCEWGLHLIPLAAATLLPTTFIITYLIAVFNGHVDAGFPYISDTGALPPESCIFGQLLNICAVLFGACAIVRWVQVAEFFTDEVKLRRLNNGALVLGLLAALGVSMVANFQETSLLPVHMTGAMLAFGVGIIYYAIQTYFSFKMVPHTVSYPICGIRLVMVIIGMFSFIIIFVFGPLSRSQFHGDDPKKWYPADGGWTYHIVSTSFEWIMAFTMTISLLTLVPEFKYVSLTTPIFIVETPARNRGEYEVVPSAQC